MKTFIAASVLASQVLAQNSGPGDVIGAASPNDWDNQSQAIWSKAITAPNATRSIKFKPFEWYAEEPFHSQEWTWRVNVSQFALPHLKDQFKRVPDPSYVSASYDFQFPDNKNLTQTLNSTDPFCVGMLTTDVVFPANVTDLYTDKDADSTSCLPVVGQACLDAISAKGGFDSKCTLGTIWSQIPECAASMGANTAMTFGVFSTDINPPKKNDTEKARTGGKNVTSTARLSGGGFAGTYSGVINGTAAPDMFLYESNRLHMVMISHAFENVRKSELLCMRVNTTKLSQDGGDGGSGNGGGNGGDGGGSAAPGQIHAGWTMAIVAVPLLALFV